MKYLEKDYIKIRAFEAGWIDAARGNKPMGYAITQTSKREKFPEYIAGYDAGRSALQIALSEFAERNIK